jgi:Plasmid pRiA4b ORF-3-like protein
MAKSTESRIYQLKVILQDVKPPVWRRLLVSSSISRAGFSLLTLDAKRGTTAEHLYRQLGWTHAGTIPRFALDPDGITPHDAVVFYKELSQTVESRAG